MLVPSCAAALCFSGGLNSFLEKNVYERTKSFLVDGLAAGGCAVDVFMHIFLDESQISSGASTSPINKYELLKPVFDTFSPVALQFHPSIIEPEYHNAYHSCTHPQQQGTYWGLLSSKSCYGLVRNREDTQGWPYNWVIHSAFDLGWLQPITSLEKFPDDRVLFSPNFSFFGSEFVMVPRVYADTFFTAVQMVDCNALGNRWTMASLHWENLAKNDVPIGHYDLPYTTVTVDQGGVCDILVPFKTHFQLLQFAGLLAAPRTRPKQKWNLKTAATLITERYQEMCKAMYPHPYNNMYSGLRPPSSHEMESAAAMLKSLKLQSDKGLSSHDAHASTLLATVKLSLGFGFSHGGVTGQHGVNIEYLKSLESFAAVGTALQCEAAKLFSIQHPAQDVNCTTPGADMHTTWLTLLHGSERKGDVWWEDIVGDDRKDEL